MTLFTNKSKSFEHFVTKMLKETLILKEKEHHGDGSSGIQWDEEARGAIKKLLNGIESAQVKCLPRIKRDKILKKTKGVQQFVTTPNSKNLRCFTYTYLESIKF